MIACDNEDVSPFLLSVASIHLVCIFLLILNESNESMNLSKCHLSFPLVFCGLFLTLIGYLVHSVTANGSIIPVLGLQQRPDSMASGIVQSAACSRSFSSCIVLGSLTVSEVGAHKQRNAILNKILQSTRC